MAEVDNAFYQTDYPNQVKVVFKDGWYAAIKFMEACQTSTNTQSKPCPGCGCKTSSVDVRICPSCVSNFE
jgi:hypothetical protein